MCFVRVGKKKITNKLIGIFFYSQGQSIDNNDILCKKKKIQNYKTRSVVSVIFFFF